MDESCDFVSTKLVEKVRSLSKKPTLDTNIHGILVECMRNVEKQSVYLENGIFNFNLAEVAIVLEHVTLIYGKKVDLLWDYLLNYQKRLLKFNTKATNRQAEEELLEERMDKYKHRRKKKQTKKLPFPWPIHIDYDSLLPQLSMEYDTGDMLSLEQQVLKDFENITIVEEEARDRYLRPFFITTSYPIYFGDEYLCDNSQILSQNFFYETYDFIRQGQYNYHRDTEIGATGHDIRDDLTQQFLVERDIKYVSMTDEQHTELHEYIEQKLLERIQKMPLPQRCKRLCPRRSSIMLTRLSQDIMEKCLKGERVSFEEACVNSQSSILNDSGIAELELNSANDNTENRQLPFENNVQKSNENMDIVTKEEVNNSRNVEENAEPTTNIGNSESEIINGNDSVKRVEDDGFIDNNMELNQVIDNNEENCTLNRTVEMTINSNKEEKNRKSKLIRTDDEDEVPKKKLCRTRETLKLRKVITKPLDDFELFFYENYKPQINEGKIVISDHIRNIYLKQSQILRTQNVVTKSLRAYEMFFYDNYTPDNAEGKLIEPVFPEMSEAEKDNLDRENTISCSQDSGICEDIGTDFDQSVSTQNEVTANKSDCLDTTITDNVIPSVAASTPLSTEPSTSNATDTSIYEVGNEPEESFCTYLDWKEGVDKKLARTDKNDFDIHEYGTQILDKLTDTEPVKFNKLVNSKKPSEVARLFIASLQLINTLNIEMLNVTSGQLANDTLEFKLLSRDRHHKHIYNYVAPSLENRAETLNRISNIKRNQASTSNISCDGTSDNSNTFTSNNRNGSTSNNRKSSTATNRKGSNASIRKTSTSNNRSSSTSNNRSASTSNNWTASTFNNQNLNARYSSTSNNSHASTSNNLDTSTSNERNFNTSNNSHASISNNLNVSISSNRNASTFSNLNASSFNNRSASTSNTSKASTSNNQNANTFTNCNASTSNNLNASTSNNSNDSFSNTLPHKRRKLT